MICPVCLSCRVIHGVKLRQQSFITQNYISTTKGKTWLDECLRSESAIHTVALICLFQIIIRIIWEGSSSLINQSVSFAVILLKAGSGVRCHALSHAGKSAESGRPDH